MSMADTIQIAKCAYALTNNITKEQANAVVRRMKKVAKKQKIKKSGLQKAFDMLLAPVAVGDIDTNESADAHNKIVKGYWEAIKLRESIYDE